MQIYKNNKKKLLYDPCRQIFLQYTPEEEVRQRLIQFLINDMRVPKDSISTEFALNNIDSNSRQRADIVVWHKDRKGNEQALLVLELKAEHVELTDHILEQVKSYNEILQAKYIGISNGRDVQIFEVLNNTIKPLVNEIYTYLELLKGKVEYTNFRKLKRLPYELTTYDRYVEYLWNIGYIGEGTPNEVHPFISELQNFILCGEIKTSEHKNGTRIIEDLSYGRFSFGNASGGTFPGYYRSFIVKDSKGNHRIYRIGVFGTPIFKDDPVYGNRKGNTYLTVAIDESGNSSNILELNVDKFFQYNKTKEVFNVFHNGRRNGFTNKEVIESVVQYSPSLIKDGQIFLGSLSANKSIDIDEGTDFIQRLLVYASIRVKLAENRNKRKTSQRK